MARLSDELKDLFDLDISEGALVNILEAARKPFAAQTNLIKQRLLSGTALASDETGMRVGKANWWLWVFHHGDSAAFVAEASRSKAVVETFLGDWRPDVWLSDRLGSQIGWARREHQFCLAHLIRAFGASAQSRSHAIGVRFSAGSLTSRPSMRTAIPASIINDHSVGGETTRTRAARDGDSFDP